MKGTGSNPVGTAIKSMYAKGYMDREAANEVTRELRVNQRRILGEYYRDLATNYAEYEKKALEIGPTLAWPSRPNIPEYANA